MKKDGVKKRKYLSGRPQFEAYLLHPRYWLVWFGLGIMWLLVQLPYKFHLILGKAAGRLLLLLSKRRRHITEVNLKLCFPDMSESERKALLVKNFESAGIAFFEMGITWWWPLWRFKRIYKIEGLEHIENLKGQGVILTTGHFTNLDIGAGAVAHYFIVDALFRMNKNHALDYVQTRGRCSNNKQTRFIARENVKDMIRSLREGRVVWYAPDQDPGRKQGVFVDLFGVPASTTYSTSRLARLGKAAVVPLSQKRLDDGSGYLVKLHPPIEGYPADDDVSDAKLLMQFVEDCIKEQPDQYMWMHRRFKTRPEGDPPVY